MKFATKIDYNEHSCACDKCRDMCRKTPCIGTPEDILRIAKAGFSDKLAESYWLVGMVNGTHDKPIRIIAPLKTEKGCAFQDEQGLCILHDLNLKPMEGRLTNNHQVGVINSLEEAFKTPPYRVAEAWSRRDYEGMRRRIFDKA